MQHKVLGLFIVIMTLALMGCPSPVTDTAITLLTIPGVVAPVYGASPVTTAIDTVQYTGTITWAPAGSPFAASTVYTANIVLTPKGGYTLTGVAANGFTVTGATATNAVNTGGVAVVFPKTAALLTMVTVPAGSFQRDDTATDISTISTAFRMSAQEITRAQFLSIMGTDPSDPTHSCGTTDSVQRINWYHAIAFCNKLSIAEGLTPVYAVIGVDFATLTYGSIPIGSDTFWDSATATWTNTGYRLPSEMEWMWAAMGGTADALSSDTVGGVNTGGYKKGYAGSTEANGGQMNIENYAWYVTNSSSTTHPVGTKAANELGLYDMSGNVLEWCWDWAADIGTWPNYAVTGTQVDYRGAASGMGRVARGGSWSFDVYSCTVARRYSFSDYEQDNYVGFRVVRP